ncbi:amidase family protein [Aegicerativicinus sediminis]|uniref:amidase family protein n=1 Tax=Aegicerativicinus sediminis TaxID=2893202 RepID=UPI001E32E203|nr:amidase family protein [Aegicerativicinus sediminis]
MINKLSLFLLILLVISCKEEPKEKIVVDRFPKAVDFVVPLETDFREFKVLDSKVLDVELMWRPLNDILDDFGGTAYEDLKPLILEKDILSLQEEIAQGKLNYEKLTLFYLYRIRELDRLNEKSLNSVITVNANAIDLAKTCDKNYQRTGQHPIYGMPILLKDNIDTKDLPTTAGATALLKNETTENAFIVDQLLKHGAVILGKANLSEWAYFFCGDCPSGYSAVGGQTLNPYGRRIFDTGGSSSGSGVSIAANFAVGAVGSETSGSILSPSSQNSLVGLKPTIGLLSRGGIVPISSTLDTPGPMTRTVRDNAILLDAMLGYDKSDPKAIETGGNGTYFNNLDTMALKGIRLGAMRKLMEDTLYVNAIETLKKQGAVIVEYDAPEIGLPNFRRLLNLDMKADLPLYLQHYGNKDLGITSVEDVIVLNEKDTLTSAPYGQRLFRGIVADSGDAEYLLRIKDTLKMNGRKFLEGAMVENNLDGILSINNYHAGFAAVAEYPAITVPMGYDNDGKPKGLTFISRPLTEKTLLEWAFAYEQASKERKMPEGYN